MNTPNKLLDRIMPWRRRARDAAWLVRAAFERGHKSSGDDWRKDWKDTPERAVLVRMGLIDEDDGFR
jgi:hypothetical protein